MIDTKKYPRYQDYFKNFLGGWSFEDGDRTLTIAGVSEEEVYDRDNSKKEKKLCVRFREEGLPMVLNVTNAETIAKVTGSDRMEDWIGKKVVVGQSRVRAFGKESMAIRVRDVKPDTAVYLCEDCRQEIQPQGRHPASELAEIAKRNCGRVLCVECMKKEKARREQGTNAEPDHSPGTTDEGSGTEVHAE